MAIPDTTTLITVWGFFIDSEEGIVTTPFSVYLKEPMVLYKTNLIILGEPMTVTPDALGYWEIELVDTTNMEGEQTYVFDFGTHMVVKEVPSTESSYNFNDLE